MWVRRVPKIKSEFKQTDPAAVADLCKPIIRLSLGVGTLPVTKLTSPAPHRDRASPNQA